MSSRRNRRNESKAHKILKEKALNFLKEQGYIAFQEYRVRIDGKLFIVDVVGFKDNESIAIECGRTCYSKIEKLKKVFSKVKRFLYTSKIHPNKWREPDEKKVEESKKNNCWFIQSFSER